MAMKSCDVRELVREMARSHRDGRGLVALLGSGISVESGIPTGDRLGPYLNYVLDRSLYEDGFDLAASGWPPLRESAGRAKAERKRGLERIYEEAERVRAPWNDTLVFLSQLRKSNDKPYLDRPNQRIIDAFAQLLIRDARPSFAHVMIAQLSRSARVRTVLTTNFDELLEKAFSAANLRLDVYDIPVYGSLPDYRLVAANPAIIKLHGTRVGIRADASIHHAPDRQDVYALAAYLCGQNLDPDLALFRPDSRGSIDDSRPADSIPSSGSGTLLPPLTLTNNLLVLGFGGRDQRIMELLIRALRVIIKQQGKRDLESVPCSVGDESASVTWPRVFWVCHTQSDLEKLAESLALVQGEDVASHFSVAVEDAQLCLHELYNELTTTVPSRGLDYDFVRDIAAVPRRDVDQSRVDDLLGLLGADASPVAARRKGDADHGSISNQLRHEPGPTQTGPGTLVIPIPDQATSLNGISSLGAAVYWAVAGQDRTPEYRVRGASSRTRQSNKRCVWLDTGAFSSPDGLARALLSRVAARTGCRETGLPRVAPDAGHIRDTLERFGVTASSWIVFVYARDGGGTDIAWTSKSPHPAGLEIQADDASPLRFTAAEGQPSPVWNEKAWQCLAAYLRALRDAGFNVLYMPFDRARRQFLQDRLPGVELGECHDMDHELLGASKLFSVSTPLFKQPHTSAQRALSAAIDWALDARASVPECYALLEPARDLTTRKLTILQALSLCRQYQSRFLLLSNAAFRCPARFNAGEHDNDELRATFMRWAVERLCELRLLRQRPGGFVWMHRDVRLSLAAVIEGRESFFGGLPPDLAAHYRELHQRVLATGRVCDRARTHLRIAEAYEVAFRSANSHWLVIEQIYHLNQAILHSPAIVSAQDRLLVERCLSRAQRALRGGIATVQREIDPDLARDLFGHGPPLRLVVPPSLTLEHERTVGLYREYEQEWARVRASFVLEPSVDAARSSPSASASTESRNDDAATLQQLTEIGTRCVATRYERSRRNYGRVANELRAVLNEILDGPGSLLLQHLWELQACPSEGHDQLRKHLKETGSKWLDQLPFGAVRRTKLVTLVRILSELCWLWTDELEDHYLFCWAPLPSTRPRSSQIRELGPSQATNPWQLCQTRRHERRRFALRVCVLANATRDLIAFLSADAYDDEDEESLKLEGYYAQALGYLGRGTEAHRRLNQAFSTLNRSRLSLRRDYRALLELRRGALYLLQAQEQYLEEQLKRSGNPALDERIDEGAARQILALLDDSWLALCRARECMISSTRSTRHWGRLLVYELRTISLYADLEHATGRITEGLVDRMPGGRMRRALEILLSEAALDGGTRVRGAQIAHGATILLGYEVDHRNARGHGSERGKDVRQRIHQLLKSWRDRQRCQETDEMQELDVGLKQQLDQFVADVAERVDKILGVADSLSPVQPAVG